MIEFTQILCPTDLSDASVRSLTHAAAFARWYEGRLTVLHVVPTFDPITVGPGVLNGPLQMVMPMSRPKVNAAGDGQRRTGIDPSESVSARR